MRRALGRELLDALEPDEQVALVTPAATWASPSTLLAVTDRRLLWLLDDAVGNRVRSLRFRDTETRRAGPRLAAPLARPAARAAALRRQALDVLRPAPGDRGGDRRARAGGAAGGAGLTRGGADAGRG